MIASYGIVVALALAQAAEQPPLRTEVQPPLQALPVLTLQEALREASAKNYDLKVAQARLDQANQAHWKAWSAYLPQVVATGELIHNNFSDIAIPAGGLGPGSPQVIIAKQDQRQGQIQATQAIFAPEAIFGIGAALAGERLATETTEQARQDILFGVAQTYYAAAALEQVVEINTRQLAIARDHEKDAKVRYDAGTTPKVTLLRAEIDRAAAEQDLKRATNAFEAGKVALATLIDRPDWRFDVEVPPPVQLPTMDSLEAGATRDRPDVKASLEQITVAEKNVQGTMSTYLPTLAAFGNYNYSNAAPSTDSTSWQIGLSARWNIFDGGLREANLRENRARVREAEASRAGTLSKARDELERARLDLESAVANREKAKEQLSLAQENQRLVNVNYRAGAATYIEVTDANAALLTAERTRVSEALNAEIAAIRLLKAGGQFNPK